MAAAPARRWLRRTRYDRYYRPTGSQYSQVPADYEITHEDPTFKQWAFNKMKGLVRWPSNLDNKDRFYEAFEEPDRYRLMTDTRAKYVDALNTLKNMEAYKTPGANKNTVVRNMEAAEDAALLNPIASDVPEILQHYLPTSKRAAAAAQGIATGFTRAKEKRFRNSFAGSEPASRSSAVSALRGVGEGILNARPGGEGISNAYKHFFDAEYLRSQGASEADVQKQLDLGMSALTNNPKMINDLGKYINKDLKATDYNKGTWGKNEIGKYFVEPITDSEKERAREHGIPKYSSIWNKIRGLPSSLIAKISGSRGRSQKEMKKDSTKDAQADIAHLLFNKDTALPEDFRETFTRHTPTAVRAGESLANHLDAINPEVGDMARKEFKRGFGKSYSMLGIPLAASQDMNYTGSDPSKNPYSTAPKSNSGQLIMGIPQGIARSVMNQNYNPPVGMNYNTQLQQNPRAKAPIYTTDRNQGFWRSTPEDQQPTYYPTPKPITDPYQGEYIKNIKEKLEKGERTDGNNK